jgi:hypothetical protein
VLGWLTSRKVDLPTRRRLAKAITVAFVWIISIVWCFFVDGAGEVVFVLVMAALWTVPVVWLASKLADRPDSIDRRMRHLEREARG